ncbi:ABC transporter permease [Pseudescherichia vulneris]|nr:ABC transporter permease [Pseudescherichia vulneris]
MAFSGWSVSKHASGGGLTLTLIIASVGIAGALPLGILLALGRRSTMPVVRILSVIFIEFWRGVPLITVLFMSSVMLPLFMAEGTSIDKLVRALVGVILFQSAYVAEVVRGGLQALPKGQYEAAESLALGLLENPGAGDPSSSPEDGYPRVGQHHHCAV